MQSVHIQDKPESKLSASLQDRQTFAEVTTRQPREGGWTAERVEAQVHVVARWRTGQMQRVRLLHKQHAQTTASLFRPEARGRFAVIPVPAGQRRWRRFRLSLSALRILQQRQITATSTRPDRKAYANGAAAPDATAVRWQRHTDRHKHGVPSDQRSTNFYVCR